MSFDIPAGGWEPREYQKAAWESWLDGCNRQLLIWHRRAGKDEINLHMHAVAAFNRPGTYWHMLPEYAQARKAIWNAVNPHTGKRRIDEAFPAHFRANTNEQEMFIRFVNGATWQAVGSDNYNSLVGTPPVGITFSEWALANPSAWAYLAPILAENGGWASFITTPRGDNHVKGMLRDLAADPGWFTQVLRASDTGAVSGEAIEDQRKTYAAIFGAEMADRLIEQEYECSFAGAIVGAFYAREMAVVRQTGIHPVEHDPKRPVHTAWDIGTRDDTSIWWWQPHGSGFVVLDCYTASGAGVEHYASICQQKAEENGWAPGIDYVPHDAKVMEWGAGKTRVETMIEHGLKPQLVPMARKLDGIQAVRMTLPKCAFHPRCEVGLSALETYRREWDDDRKCFRENEVRDWTTHLSDAFRYLALAARELPAPPPPKPAWKPQMGVPIGPPPSRRHRERRLA